MAEKKLFYQNMSIYILHRSNEQDHEKGRPAILLKYKSKTSLVWWGTHLKDNKTNEKPLVLVINNLKGYFYSKGIEKVNSTNLKKGWIDFRTYKPYSLTSEERKKLISKFITFTFEKDPYLELNKIKKRITELDSYINILESENVKLKQQLNKYIKIESEVINLNNIEDIKNLETGKNND